MEQTQICGENILGSTPLQKKNIIGPKWRKAVSLDGGWHHLCIFEESGPNVWWAGRVASGKLEPWQQKHMGKNWYLQVLRGGCCCCFCCWVGGWVVCFPEIPVCEDEDLSSNDALGDPPIERYSSTGGLLGQFFFLIKLYRQHLSNDMSMTYLSNEGATYLSQDASHHQGCHIF